MFVSEEAAKQLVQTDFTRHFAVLIFWGWQYRLQEGRFRLENITRQGGEIALVGTDGECLECVYLDIINSPYHLIRIPRQGDGWGKTFVFNLYFDQTQPQVASALHYLE